jgi:peptide/nickel transport system permease protein
VPSAPDLIQSPKFKQWPDLPLIVGAILLTGMAVLFFFGPQLAPHSPFTTHGLTYVDGRFIVPPFAPDDVYPWGSDALGRDMMSLILVGAQQTLLLVTLVVAARLLIGLFLGALAGWLNGSVLDRIILGIAEVVAAFPTLLLAMILILTLGIRQGLSTFLVALCLIGWGEIMQLVRAEVLAIRPKPYIEGAITIGLRPAGILGKHVLPNLLPLLVSVAALEMGAVLMLLGELGFIGIFIGGGAFAELDIGAAPYHYSDVPEWGALLSNVRTYARGYPWIALYPALAFFVAILGFNLFGEGLRRQLERGSVGLGRLANRYTFALILTLILGIGWLRTNFGAIAIYRQQAALFDGDTVLAHVERLADPVLAGRGLGTPGMDQTADYIAAQFTALGVQPAGEALTPFQSRRRSYQSIDATPIFTIDDGDAAPVYRQDFAEYAGPARNLGQAAGPVQALLFADLSESRSFGSISFPTIKGKDYSDDVLLLLSPADLYYLREVPHGGILVVAEDPLLLARRMTLSNLTPGYRLFTGEQIGRDIPIFWVSETLADRLLAPAQTSVDTLRRQASTLEPDQILEVPTGVDVALSIEGTIHEDATVRHVAGYLPGQSASLPGGGEAMDSQMIVVLAQYDSPPPGPEGVFPAANDNASGVAIMLEAIRTLQKSGYQPYRTLLFVAYVGEGIEGGRELLEPEAAEFLKGKYGFANNYTVEAVVRLRGLGAGSADGLTITTGGSQRLAQLAEGVAAQVGVAAKRTREPMDISVVFDEGTAFDSGQEAPDLTLSWAGWETTAHTAGDRFDAIDVTKLTMSGRVLTQLLMVLGREVQY